MTTIETHTVRSEGLTLSRIVWRRFRKHMPGLVERTLALNPGICELGPELPLGFAIKIPIDPPRSTTMASRVVNLWS